MVIPVGEAQKQVGRVFPISLSDLIEPQDFAGRTIIFTGPVQIDGSFCYDGSAFHVQANASVSYETECARCARSFIETLRFPVDEFFVRDIFWDDDQDSYPYTSERIDLKQAFFDNLFLHFPLISLCKPDCLGLCPICGTDLNEQTCSCSRNIPDIRFGLLEQLLNENKEV